MYNLVQCCECGYYAFNLVSGRLTPAASSRSSEHSLCSESDSPGSLDEMSGLRSRLTSLVDPAVSEFCIPFNKDLYDNPSHDAYEV